MPELHALKSWYSHQDGGLITLEDDVLGIVSQVRDMYDGRVKIDFDPDMGMYHFAEHCEDTTIRLIFSVPELDARVIERLQRADSQSRGFEDPYDAAEREQDALFAAQESAEREKINEMGEELIFNIQKDGRALFLTKPVYIPRGLDA